MITVEDCCKCISLRVGSIVIGALELVWAFLFNGLSFGGYGIGSYGFGSPADYLVPVLILLAWIIAAALLLAGIFLDNKKLIFAYLIIILIVVILDLILAVVTAVLYIMDDYVVRGSVILALHVILDAVQIYFWIVVYSYYKGGE